jgi:hypothetical protein
MIKSLTRSSPQGGQTSRIDHRLHGTCFLVEHQGGCWQAGLTGSRRGNAGDFHGCAHSFDSRRHPQRGVAVGSDRGTERQDHVRLSRCANENRGHEGHQIRGRETARYLRYMARTEYEERHGRQLQGYTVNSTKYPSSFSPRTRTRLVSPLVFHCPCGRDYNLFTLYECLCFYNTCILS